jgi:hypothetical protein
MEPANEIAQHRGLYAHGHIGSASHTGSRAVAQRAAQLVKQPDWLVRFARPSTDQPGGDWHTVVERGVRRCTLTEVVFPIADGDEGGLNVERRMRGV